MRRRWIWGHCDGIGVTRGVSRQCRSDLPLKCAGSVDHCQRFDYYLSPVEFVSNNKARRQRLYGDSIPEPTSAIEV